MRNETFNIMANTGRCGDLVEVYQENGALFSSKTQGKIWYCGFERI
jgi:hypothetical protein